MTGHSFDRPAVVRFGWGLFLLCAPGAGMRALGGQPTSGARTVLRLLGTRHVLQAVVEQRDGGRHRLLLASVDWLHAASGVGFAAFDRRWRRPALTDAALATAFGISTARASRRRVDGRTGG